MSEATKLAEYLGFEVVYLDGFAYIQEEGTNGPEIKRDATLEERTLWTELEHVSAELAALKAAIGEPVAWRFLDKDPLGGDDDRWVVYTKDEFKPGVNPTDFFDVEPLCVIPKDKP